MVNENTQQVAKHVVDVASYGTVIGAYLGYLPTIAAAFSIIWISIQIWESKTVAKLRSKLRRK